MDKYILFLDESQINGDTFVGGFIIPEKEINNLNKKMLEIKSLIWDESYMKNHSTVLHCTELYNIYKNRRNKFFLKNFHNVLAKKKPEEIKNVYDEIYKKLCEIVKQIDITVVGCIVNRKSYDYLFLPEFKSIINDPIDIGFNVVLENYVHFLKTNNVIGHIVYEARNGDNNDISKNSPDWIMNNNFCRIKTNSKGVLYIKQSNIENHISSLEFISKYEENSGLEFADFICFNLLKAYTAANGQEKPEFVKKLEKKIYNGGNDEKDLKAFYGVRIIPEDFEKVQNLTGELKSLKEAHKKLKKEKDKIQEQYNTVKSEKEELKNKNNELKNENAALKNELNEITNKFNQIQEEFKHNMHSS